jgi:hypothetical protein
MLLRGMDGEIKRFVVDRLSLAGSLGAFIELWPSHLVAPLGDAVAGVLQSARGGVEPASGLTLSRRPR